MGLIRTVGTPALVGATVSNTAACSALVTPMGATAFSAATFATQFFAEHFFGVRGKDRIEKSDVQIFTFWTVVSASVYLQGIVATSFAYLLHNAALTLTNRLSLWLEMESSARV